MALGVTAVTAAEIANTALKFYIKGPALMQTIQEKPLLAWLQERQSEFSGGSGTISEPVKGQKMSDTATFLQGYTGTANALTFVDGGGILRAEYEWKELFAGWWINWTDLKIDGITIIDSNKVSKHSRAEIHQITSIYEDRVEDFAESWAVSTNQMFWRDGAADPLKVPGITALVPKELNTVGLCGGLNRATYTWWRHRQATGIQASPADQTLSKKLRSEVRQLKRYGGRPDSPFAGSEFLDALADEVAEKGEYTTEGFAKGEKNDIGMADIRMRGVGVFKYDPTLDDEGMSKSCFLLDGRRIKLRPMTGENNKVLRCERPYNYLVFLQGMTWTGGLTASQLNCHGYYAIA